MRPRFFTPQRMLWIPTVAISALFLFGCSDWDHPEFMEEEDGRISLETFSNWNPVRSDFFSKSLSIEAVDRRRFNSAFVTTSITANDDTARAIAYLSDGKYIVAGRANNGSFNDFALVRYWPDGSLDTGFSGDGIAVTSFAEGEAIVHGLVVDGSGRYVVAGRRFGTTDYDFGVSRYSTDGTPDTSFGASGHVRVDFGGNEFSRALEIDSQGRIVVVGHTDNATSSWDLAIARLTGTGALDGNFSGDGQQTDSLLGAANEWYTAYDVLIDAQDRIVVGGRYRQAGGINDMMIARYNTDGGLDSANFNGTSPGYRIRNFTNDDVVWALAQSPNDFTFRLVGRSLNGAVNELRFHRVLSNGGGNTNTTTQLGTSTVGRGAVADHLGGFLVASRVNDGTDWNFGISRFQSDGNANIDAGFATAGSTTVQVTAVDDSAYAIAQQGGKIIMAGRMFNGANRDFAIVRINSTGGIAASGDFDENFATNGQDIRALGGGTDQFRDIAIDAEGRYVVTGRDSGSLLLARYLTNGTLDATLDDGVTGTPGIVTNDLVAGTGDVGVAVTIQPDGKLVVGGISSNNTMVARFYSDGVLDSTFDTDGWNILDTGGSDQGYDVATDSRGRLVVVGRSSNGGGANFSVAMFYSDGAVDTTFNSGGAIPGAFIQDFGGALQDQAEGIFIHDDNKIAVVGFVDDATGDNWFMLRLHSNGVLDTEFNGGGGTPGTLEFDPGGSGTDRLYVVEFSSSRGQYFVAGRENGAFAVGRYFTDGVLDTAFNNGGAIQGVAEADENGTDQARDMVLMGNGKIMVGGISNGVDWGFARFYGDGVVDSTFSVDGTIGFNLGGIDDECRGMKIDNAGAIVGVGFVENANDDTGIVRMWP